MPRKMTLALAAFFIAIGATSGARAQEDPNGGSLAPPGRQIEGVTGSFNAVTKAYKYLFTAGPVVIGLFNPPASPNCLRLGLQIKNNTNSSQQALVEFWRAGSTLVSSSTQAFGADGLAFPVLGSIGPGGNGCTNVGDNYAVKIYSTTASLTMTGYINIDGQFFDQSYRDFLYNIFYAGSFQRSVLTASFSFGSSAGVCATTPENSIKVHNTDAFPASPAFGDYGWATSGSALNIDTCSGSAFADLFLRSSANISGPGKWTFIYQVPNGAYDVTILYNTASVPAGDTTITLNGRTVVFAESSPASNLSQTSQRINVGGNQILVGVSSASGTAVLNGVIITPLAQ